MISCTNVSEGISSLHCSAGTELIDVHVNSAGREWHRGLLVGAGNPVQRSVLHVQADGESLAVFVLVCDTLGVYEAHFLR